MKETLEKLWNEYLLDECAGIDTNEERELTKNTAELHEKANALLNKEQRDAVKNMLMNCAILKRYLLKRHSSKGVNLRFRFY